MAAFAAAGVEIAVRRGEVPLSLLAALPLRPHGATARVEASLPMELTSASGE
jgi:hypothetical protein